MQGRRGRRRRVEPGNGARDARRWSGPKSLGETEEEGTALVRIEQRVVAEDFRRHRRAGRLAAARKQEFATGEQRFGRVAAAGCQPAADRSERPRSVMFSVSRRFGRGCCPACGGGCRLGHRGRHAAVVASGRQACGGRFEVTAATVAADRDKGVAALRGSSRLEPRVDHGATLFLDSTTAQARATGRLDLVGPCDADRLARRRRPPRCRHSPAADRSACRCRWRARHSRRDARPASTVSATSSRGC